MIFVSLFVTCFTSNLMTCCINFGFILGLLWHSLATLSHPFSQLVGFCAAEDALSGLFFGVGHPFGFVLVSFSNPFGFDLASIWVLLAFFFLPFAARHAIIMHFHIMYLDFCFATFLLLARCRDCGFAAQRDILIYTYIYIY